VVRKIVVNTPDAGVPDFGIRVAQNRLAVKFRRCDVPGSFASCHGAVYAVVDATTGQRLADYEAEEEAASAIACYAPNPDRFFTFWIASDRHHLEIVEAVPK
jgi:hypothetical protein